MKSIVFVVLIFTGCLVDNSSGIAVTLSGVLDIIKIAKDIVVVIAKAWNLVDQHVDFSDIPIPILDKTESKIFGKLGIISAKLDQLAEQIDTTGTVTITTILRSLPDRVRLELRLNDLSDYLTRMDVVYQRFQNYVKKQNDFERLTLEDFAKHVVSHDSSSVNNLVERIYAFLVPNSRGITDGGLLHLLDKSLELCTKRNKLSFDF